MVAAGIVQNFSGGEQLPVDPCTRTGLKPSVNHKIRWRDAVQGFVKKGQRRARASQQRKLIL
jgi:hypothetical protein